MEEIEKKEQEIPEIEPEKSGAESNGEQEQTAETPEAKQGTSAEQEVKEASQNETGIEKKWYVLHTLSGHEQKVKKNIEHHLETSEVKDYVGRVLIPSETVSEVRGGKKSVTERKIFPGYVLVEMSLTNEAWYYLKGIDGVIGFVGSSMPQPLMEHEAENILKQLDDKKEKVRPKVLFEKGEMIKINDGPFVNFTGVIDEVQPDKGKLKVMVSIFGRATPVELEYWQVERS